MHTPNKMEIDMSQYKHPYLTVKLNKAKNDFDFFMYDIIKNYNQNAFKLSEKLSGITCVRRYAALVYHADFVNILGTRLTLSEAEVAELQTHFGTNDSLSWDLIPEYDEDDNPLSNDQILNHISSMDLLPAVYIKYLQRLNDNIELFQHHNRVSPYQVTLDLTSTILSGKASIIVSMVGMGEDPSQFIYNSEAKKFYKKDVDRNKFQHIQSKYSDLNFTIFKLLHRHIYHVLSTRIIPSIELLELNASSKKCTVHTLFSPSELLSYDEKGDLEDLVGEFIKSHPLHKEDMKRAIEVLKFEYGLSISNTQNKLKDNVIDKEYLIYELGIK